MSLIALHATLHGPSGFSFASITTAPGWSTFSFRCARASAGSVRMRKATVAEATADICRKVRREPRVHPPFVLMRSSSPFGLAILCAEARLVKSKPCLHRQTIRLHQATLDLDQK